MLTNELHSNDRLHRVYQSCPPEGGVLFSFLSFFCSLLGAQKLSPKLGTIWQAVLLRLHHVAVRGDAQMDAFYFPGQAKRICAFAARLSLVTDKRTNGVNGRYPARRTLASGWCELSTQNMPIVLRLHEWNENSI